MPAERCGDCGEEFVWDSDGGAAVCVVCGTLQDPSSVVLDSHLDDVDRAVDQSGHTFSRHTTLKSFRNSNGWDLAGQGGAATAERSKTYMRNYIAALARRVGYSGLVPRVQMLFDQAMERGGFRWGRKARLVAGACLLIALREARRGETVKDIAYVVDETPVAVARVLTAVLGLLKITLTSLDPSWHLPLLQKRLLEILTEAAPALPQKLVTVLRSIHLPSALRTASSLCDLVSRSGVAANESSQPTACAVFILALEGEISSSLPNSGQLASALGVRIGASKDSVMRRYKLIYDEIERWSTALPWLASNSPKRVKTAKRVVVARSIKDVVQFQESIWRSSFRAEEPLRVQSVDGEAPVSRPELAPEAVVDLQRDSVTSAPSPLPLPRTKWKSRRLEGSSQFLLSPLARDAARKRVRRAAVRPPDVSSHLLTVDQPSLDHPPTRLQLLASSKGVDSITDEELFAEGELDGLMRNDAEREVLLETCDWAQESDDDDEVGEETHLRHAWNRDSEHGGTSRVNIDALNRLLEEKESGWGEPYYREDGDWRTLLASRYGEGGHLGDASSRKRSAIDEVPWSDKGDGENLGAWRELSPDEGTSWTDVSRYEEA